MAVYQQPTQPDADCPADTSAAPSPSPLPAGSSTTPGAPKVRQGRSDGLAWTAHRIPVLAGLDALAVIQHGRVLRHILKPEACNPKRLHAVQWQFGHQWRVNAAEHVNYTENSFEDFRYSGIGKAALLVANGYSFEENLETIQKYKNNVDIICCDKTLGHLLDNGIEPYICIVCDANVNYEKYTHKWKDRLQNTYLFNNVCGNPKWTKLGNWKKIYTYVNKDVMNYEKEFIEISGCKNVVTAGTNVSNMMIVLMVQASNEMHQNLFAYDKIVLIGFDYSWRQDGKYYAFDDDGGGKFNFMRHIYSLSKEHKVIYTSNNLASSASWIKQYTDSFRVPVVQCSTHSLQPFGNTYKLEKNLNYRHRPSDSNLISSKVKRKFEIELELKKINNEIERVAQDHYLVSLASR